MSLIPVPYQVRSIVQETSDVFTLSLSREGKGLEFLPGQFNMLYPFGHGETAISISGDPGKKDELVHTIRAVGSATTALQKLQTGDEIGVRGPYGSHWPLEQSREDVLVITGGIGIAALRSVLYQLSSQAEKRRVTLLYGSRMPEDIFYKNDLETFRKKGMNIEITVDHADLQWKGNIGVVTTLIRKNLPNPKNTLIFMCGPEIMMRFAIDELMQMNANESNIYLSMERNMQCALGFCGHCQYGPHFICKDGPVFAYPKLKYWMPIKEL